MLELSIVIPAYNSEPYLEDLINSIEKQRCYNYEVVIVNDGSTDGTWNKLNELCGNDNKYILHNQENGGVSAARNSGLKLARGKYIFFCDSDDIIPKDAIPNILNAANEKDADLVVGRVKMQRTIESSTTASTIRLSKQDEISKLDKDWVWTLRVTNKLYKKEVLDKINLRFDESLHIFEDAIFLIEFIRECNIICGCNNVVHYYNKRPFWEATSITQDISEEKMRNFNSGFRMLEKSILKLVESVEIPPNCTNGERREIIAQKETFVSTFYKKIMKSTIIEENYKHIWSSKNDFTFMLSDMYETCKIEMFPSMFRELANRNSEIDKDIGLKNRAQLAKAPQISLVFRDVKEDLNFNYILKSLYTQDFVSFEVIVPEILSGYIDESYKNRENFVIYNNDTVDSIIKGDYTLFINDESLFVDNYLLRLANILEDPIIQCAKAGFKYFNNGKISDLKEKEFLAADEKSTSNKLYRTNIVRHVPKHEVEVKTVLADDIFILKVVRDE